MCRIVNPKILGSNPNIAANFIGESMEGGDVSIFSRSDKYRDNWGFIFKPQNTFYELSDEEFLKRFKKAVKNNIPNNLKKESTIMKSDYSPDQVKDIIKTIEPYLPLVDDILNKAAPVLDKIFSCLSNYMREQNATSIKYYVSQGMTREEAFLLTIKSNVALQKALDNIGKGKK